MSIMCQLSLILAWTLLVFTIFKSARAFHARNERSITTPDKETDIKIAQMTREMNMNSEQCESDITRNKRVKRNAIKYDCALWPNGTIYYVISHVFSDTEFYLIQNAMKMIMNKSEGCLKFKWKVIEKDFVKITRAKTKCWCNCGRIGGEQIMNLVPPCTNNIDTIMHMLLHAAGFMHEHNRSDRDQYVDINWGNIQTEHYKEFIEDRPRQTNTCNLRYDYNSIMHLPKDTFAKNKKQNTITPNKI